MIKTGISFLEYYLQFFGDRKMAYVDLLPETSELGTRQHVPLDEKLIGLPPEKAAEEMDKYTHPCWCHPELIYADDTKGNEVWLHKREQ